MSNVRITGTSRRNIHKTEWLGAPLIDSSNHIERSLDLPEAVYQRMEEGIGKGFNEGFINVDDGRRIEWFLDRGSIIAGANTVGSGEGI